MTSPAGFVVGFVWVFGMLGAFGLYLYKHWGEDPNNSVKPHNTKRCRASGLVPGDIVLFNDRVSDKIISIRKMDEPLRLISDQSGTAVALEICFERELPVIAHPHKDVLVIDAG